MSTQEEPAFPFDGDTLDLLRVLNERLGQNHTALTDSQAVLSTTTQVLAGVLRRLQRPDLDAAPFATDIDDVDRRLLALLDRGEKVDSIPRMLGLTRYDMRARMNRMYDLTGSARPFQFGRAACSRLWIPADPGTPRQV